jgi:hypothetical protein
MHGTSRTLQDGVFHRRLRGHPVGVPGLVHLDTERPPDDVTALLGGPGHRWLTAQGPFEGNTALLDIVVTEGGVFDSAEPLPENHGDGTIELVFEDCTKGVVNYHIESLDLTGTIPIQRVAESNVALCEALAQ